MEVEVGIRKLCKNFGFQDLIGWTAGMGGCMEDIGSPAVHGGRVLRMVKEVDIRQEKFLVQ